MERLQHILSTWKVDDLNTILRFSDGDCECAINRILKHEIAGLPAEALIRSLDGAKAPCAEQRRQRRRHAEGGVTDPGSMGGNATGCDDPQSFRFDSAARPPLYATRRSPRYGRRSEMPNALSRHQSHTASSCKDFSWFPAIPPVVWVEAESYGRGRHGSNSNLHFNPRDPFQTLETRSSSHDADTDLGKIDVPPEILLQQMTPSEKDQLMHRLLSSNGLSGGQVRRSQAETIIATKFTTREVEVINVQSGLLMSLKGKPRNPRSEDIDYEAMKLGSRVSEEEFRRFCRRHDRAKETEKAIIEKVKLKSLRFQDLADQEASLIDEIKRVSLAPSYSMTNEERLIQDVKHESSICLAEKGGPIQGFKATSAEIPVTLECSNQALPNALPVTRPVWSFSTLAFPDETLNENATHLPFLPTKEAADYSSSSISDRKPPARHRTQASDASI